jgi:hypothetical protein
MTLKANVVHLSDWLVHLVTMPQMSGAINSIIVYLKQLNSKSTTLFPEYDL